MGDRKYCCFIWIYLSLFKNNIYRNRQNTDGKYIAKLSLEELNCFYEQVASLPCIIKEGKLLKVNPVIYIRERCSQIEPVV